MKTLANNRSAAWLGAFGITVCVLATASIRAEEMTPQALVDRAEIEDLITRYYYNFGNENSESFANFYADDAELILGERHYKGREGIAEAYNRAGGGEDSPIRSAYSFNVTIGNPLIVVHGDTASAKLIFTEYLMDKPGEAPHLRTQGREYSTFVKVKGQWRYKTRQIMGGTKPPEGWKE